MKIFLKIFVLLPFVLLNRFEAQQVVKADTLSGTPLILTMDKKIGDLLSDIEDKCAIKLADNNSTTWKNDEEVRSSTPKISIPEKELTQAEICRRNPRIMGYKIQLSVVKSNEEAREVGMYFRRRFPNMKVEIDASLRPNYKVMAGSYLSKETAYSDFSSVKKSFKDARLIPYRVFCVEAK